VGNEAVWQASEEPLSTDYTRRTGQAAVANKLGVASPTVWQAIEAYRVWLRERALVQVKGLVRSGE
jgi:hypothetical protein